jgi:putative aminopeptidase FrvX
MHSHPALQLLEKLLDAPAPSGREERIAALICAELDGLGYAHETDPAGNVLVRLDGSKSDLGLCIFAAHMDEIGIVVIGIEPDGSLRVDASGGLVPHKSGECALDIVGDGEVLKGVLSFGSWHSGGADKPLGWDGARILTGLSPAQLAESGVRIGSTAVPVREARGPVVFGDHADPLVGAWTFDDRMGVVAQLRLLREMKERAIVPARSTIIAFTVHEEGGCHGAKVLAHREKPEVFIAVDGCPMAPGSGLVLDGRPATWSKDAKAHLDQRLMRDFCRAAREAGTELQVVVLGGYAYSDATSVYDSGGAPRVGILGHVRENSHGFEVARLSVFDNLHKTLVRFIETWE